MQILSPKRRIDILRYVMLAKEKGSPYVITFCGVNGVGKSTNLAKVCVCVRLCVCVCLSEVWCSTDCALAHNVHVHNYLTW